MNDHWISVDEASRRLNVSVSTIRRRIEQGGLEAEREIIGGSRERYRVRLATPHDASGDASDPPMPSESGDASTVTTEPSAAITGLLDLVREIRQQGVSDASLIGDLQRQLGRAEARAELLEAEVARLKRSWWWRLWSG